MDVDDGTVSIDEVGDRHADSSQFLGYTTVAIEVVRECETELGDERLGRILVVLHVDADERHLVAEPFVGDSKQRRLRATRDTPRRPHIDNSGTIQVCQDSGEMVSIGLDESVSRSICR